MAKIINVTIIVINYIMQIPHDILSMVTSMNLQTIDKIFLMKC